MNVRALCVAALALACRRVDHPTPAPVAPPPPRAVPAPVPAAPDGGAAASAEGAPDALVDLDGDGQVDQVFNDPPRVVRHGRDPEALSLDSADQSNVITGRLPLGGRIFVVVEGVGHEVDHDAPGGARSYTWGGVGLFEFRPGEGARVAWEFRTEANQVDPASWRFAPQSDGTILATSTLGDDGLPHTAVTARLARTAAGDLHAVTCWQPALPSIAETPCTTTVRSSFHLRLTETMRPSESAPSYPAGTRVTVLQRGTVRRGAATLSCVRLPDEAGSVGWAFVTDAERARCAP